MQDTFSYQFFIILKILGGRVPSSPPPPPPHHPYSAVPAPKCQDERTGRAESNGELMYVWFANERAKTRPCRSHYRVITYLRPSQVLSTTKESGLPRRVP